MPAFVAPAACGRFQSAAATMALIALLVPSDNLAPARAAHAARTLGEAGMAAKPKAFRKRSDGVGSEGGGVHVAGGTPEMATVNGTGHDEAAPAEGTSSVVLGATAQVNEEEERKDESFVAEETNVDVPPAAAAAAAVTAAEKQQIEASAHSETSPEREETQRRQIERDHPDKQDMDGDGDGDGDAAEEGGGDSGPEMDFAKEGALGAGASGSAQAAGVQVGPFSEPRASDGFGEAEARDVQMEEVEDCRVAGPCLWCAEDEMLLEFCKETGRRQEMRCSGRSGEQDGAVLGMLPGSVEYRSCDYVEGEDFLGLFHFWLTMVALGASACFFMRRRQKRGGSLYDRRAK